jgi:hypothetical protein
MISITQAAGKWRAENGCNFEPWVRDWHPPDSGFNASHIRGRVRDFSLFPKWAKLRALADGVRFVSERLSSGN